MVMWAPSSVRDRRQQGVAGRRGVHVGREAERELQRGRRPQHVAAVPWRGQPVGAGDLQRGAPGAGDQAIDRVGRQQAQPVDDRRGAVGEGRGDGLEAGPLGHGYPRPTELGQEDAAGLLVFDLRKDAAEDPERRRDDPATLPAVDALGEHVDTDGRDQVPPQRRGQPEAVVAEAARVEADDEARRADALARGGPDRRRGPGCRSPRSPRSGRGRGRGRRPPPPALSRRRTRSSRRRRCRARRGCRRRVRARTGPARCATLRGAAACPCGRR